MNSEQLEVAIDKIFKNNGLNSKEREFINAKTAQDGGCTGQITSVEIVDEGNFQYGYVYHYANGSAILSSWDCSQDECVNTSRMCYDGSGTPYPQEHF